MLNLSVRRARRGLILAVLALVAGATACEDPFEITAQYPNVDQTFELWAISGSPAAYPSGLLVVAPGLPQATAVRLDASGNFDIAVDIDALGRLTRPAGRQRRLADRRLACDPVPAADGVVQRHSRRASRRMVAGLRAAPSARGQAFLLRISTLYCQFDIRQDIYAKFYVDSIIPADRRVKLRSRINPNCGFRSLLNGVPEY
jgi:hypothetical protein